MPWTVTFHADRQFVELSYAGTVPPADLQASIVRTLQVCLENNCGNLLSDCSALEGGHSVVDLYDAATAVTAEHGVERLREALVLPTAISARDAAQFWETAAMNRGLQVQLFTNRDAAMAWLLAD